jgi:hypothetical protein
MPRFGPVIAVSAIFLAAASPAQPERVAEPSAPQPACRFTLERNTQITTTDNGGETWVLTCHRSQTQNSDTRSDPPRSKPEPSLPATD